jgi:pyridoxal phosphate enzyme (YggS family)
MWDIAASHRRILEQIGEAAAKSGRDPAQIKLLAAAKSQTIDSIRSAITCGVSLIGENYVQEARDKIRAIGGTAEWHMIGHLQRNKAKLAVALFDVIESLDSIALARELNAEGQNRGRIVRALVEVKLGGEESKSGIKPAQIRELLKCASELSNVRIEGLMTIPPLKNGLEELRPYFKQLCDLRESLRREQAANISLDELSMGMTQDFVVAIEEGATIIRIGTALFGPRKR